MLIKNYYTEDPVQLSVKSKGMFVFLYRLFKDVIENIVYNCSDFVAIKIFLKKNKKKKSFFI